MEVNLTLTRVGYGLNRLDKPVFKAVSKLLLTEFGIHHRLESCAKHSAMLTFIALENVVVYQPDLW